MGNKWGTNGEQMGNKWGTWNQDEDLSHGSRKLCVAMLKVLQLVGLPFGHLHRLD
jgi:hypothetical protein